MIIWGILIYGTAVEENQTTSFSTGLDVGLKSSTTLKLKSSSSSNVFGLPKKVNMILLNGRG